MLNGILSNALSGLFAQKRATQAHASNIANVSTIGHLPESGGNVEKPAYTPYDSVNIASENGGVKSEFIARDPAYSPIYYPSSVYANEDGLIAAPEVSLDQEVIGLRQATHSYKANLAVIRTAEELSDELLDIFT